MRTALVTGGTRRLGLAIAERLRSDGWRVLAASHRDDAGADLLADLSLPGAAERLFAAARALNGGLPPDALVNNAAIFTGNDAILRAVNFDAPARLAELMANDRSDCDRSVVNILDSRVLAPEIPSGAYYSAKLALLEHTRTSAARFADVLRVNAVAPGPVLPPEGVHDKAERTPLGRPTPADVADAVSWLLRAKATSGCIIPVDGAAHLVRDKR